MSTQSDTVNSAISGSDLIKQVWQGYVPPQYDYLPKQWDQKTRATMIVRDILQKSGVNDSGMSFNDDGSVKDANAKTMLDHIVDASPYIIGGVAGAAALGAFGGGVSGVSGAAPEIAVTSSGPLTGVAAPTAAGLSAGTGGTTAAATGTGAFSSLLNNAGVVGKGLDAVAGSMVHNRGTELSAAQDANAQFERELLARDINSRNDRNNNLRQSTFAGLLAGYQPGSRPAGVNPSPFNFSSGPQHDALSFGASDALKRLQAGDTLPPMTDPRTTAAAKSSPSIWERILGYGGAGASLLGAWK